MKEYQDTDTGMIYAFDDDYDPFTVNNRNIPKTLTSDIKLKPDDSHVWYQNAWVKQEDVPAGYTAPISSVPSYNPAWIAHLRPYSAVHRDAFSGLNATLDQINANSYDGSKLAEVVTLLPLKNSSGIPALVSYDGALAIPQCADYPSRTDGVRKLNELLCSLLLGGVHVEVLRSEHLVIGGLHEKKSLFAYTPSLHTSLRLNWAAPQDRLGPLMHPRILMVKEIHKAFHQGQQVIQSLASFTPLFLLNGYTAMEYRNKSDALNNLWITVEQLTEHLWNVQYKTKIHSFPAIVARVQARQKFKRSLKNIATKHILMCFANIVSRECYRVLSNARKTRNKLAHEGIVPDATLITQLWSVLPELIEAASGVKPLGLRFLPGAVPANWGAPEKANFEEWVNLAKSV